WWSLRASCFACQALGGPPPGPRGEGAGPPLSLGPGFSRKSDTQSYLAWAVRHPSPPRRSSGRRLLIPVGEGIAGHSAKAAVPRKFRLLTLLILLARCLLQFPKRHVMLFQKPDEVLLRDAPFVGPRSAVAGQAAGVKPLEDSSRRHPANPG